MALNILLFLYGYIESLANAYKKDVDAFTIV